MWMAHFCIMRTYCLAESLAFHNWKDLKHTRISTREKESSLCFSYCDNKNSILILYFVIVTELSVSYGIFMD
jgi:hypothetical protein